MSILSSADVVRHVGEQDAGWADTGTGVELKVVRFDRDVGTWVIRNRFQPGTRLQIHRHTGPVDGFTLEGSWHYLEYDFFSTAGSYIFEPANSVHTLDVPTENSGVTDVLFVIEGALLNLDGDGNVESFTDGPSIMAAYFAMLEAQGDPRPNGLIV